MVSDIKPRIRTTPPPPSPPPPPPPPPVRWITEIGQYQWIHTEVGSCFNGSFQLIKSEIRFTFLSAFLVYQKYVADLWWIQPVNPCITCTQIVYGLALGWSGWSGWEGVVWGEKGWSGWEGVIARHFDLTLWLNCHSKIVGSWKRLLVYYFLYMNFLL